LLEIVYAMGTRGASSSGQGGGFEALIPLILMFVIFYFLLIRPQQKKAKEHRQLLDRLRKGDRVITTGGIYGKIIGIDGGIVTLEIADKVRIKLNKGNIAGLAETGSSGSKSKKT